MMFNSNLGFGSRLIGFGDLTYHMDHMWNDGRWLGSYYHTSWGTGTWLFTAVLLVAVAAVLVIALVGVKQKKRSAALEPLKQRFIKGEITEEEYLAMKDVVLKK